MSIKSIINRIFNNQNNNTTTMTDFGKLVSAINESNKTLVKDMATIMTNQMTEVLDRFFGADPEDPAKPAVRRGGYKGGKKSTFENTADLVFVREYSKACHVVYGDTKDKEDRIVVIASFIPEDKAVSPRMISIIDGSPWGYFVPTKSLEEQGGVDALVAALERTGARVEVLASLAEETAARRKEQRKGAAAATDTAKPTEDKAVPQPAANDDDNDTASPTMTAEPIKAEEPIEQPEPTKAEEPAKPIKPAIPMQVVAPAKPDPVTVVAARCYEKAKTETGHAVNTRDLQEIDGYAYLQAAKGAMVYVPFGKTADDNSTIYVQIAKVKGNVSDIADDVKATWSAIAADGIEAAVKDGRIKATMAMVYAIFDAADFDQARMEAMYNAVPDEAEAA